MRVKVGIMAQRIMFPFTQPPASRGTFTFSGQYTSIVNQTDGSTGIAQMLLSPTSSSSIAGANTVTLSNLHSHDLRRAYFGAYAQDDWKITPKLTVNLGLRWEYFGYMYDRFGDNANFVPNTGFAGGTFYIPNTRSSLLPASFTNALQSEGIQVQTTGLALGTVP
jgi:outer membrane receptor protein involved in Fe transport